MFVHYFIERLKHTIFFRNSRGFGVHSPFVFTLITNVLKDRTIYYNFVDIKRVTKCKKEDAAIYELLFKLVLFFDSNRVYISNRDKGVAYRYVLSASMRIHFVTDRADFIFWGDDDFKYEFVSETFQGVLFIPGININVNKYNFWKNYSGRATVKIEALDYGILIFDETKQQGHYYI